jgi:hypothetical protein
MRIQTYAHKHAHTCICPTCRPSIDASIHASHATTQVCALAFLATTGNVSTSSTPGCSNCSSRKGTSLVFMNSVNQSGMKPVSLLICTRKVDTSRPALVHGTHRVLPSGVLIWMLIVLVPMCVYMQDPAHGIQECGQKAACVDIPQHQFGLWGLNLVRSRRSNSHPCQSMFARVKTRAEVAKMTQLVANIHKNLLKMHG